MTDILFSVYLSYNTANTIDINLINKENNIEIYWHNNSGQNVKNSEMIQI